MDLIAELTALLEGLGTDWTIRGLLDSSDQLYTIGTDTKLLGRIFELMVTPAIEQFAQKHGLTVACPEGQNIYPDYTLMTGEGDNEKIAIDVKTTYWSYYASGDKAPASFTLGSFASFLRNNTKNIDFPYDTYSKHYVIGFIYERASLNGQAGIVQLEDRGSILCPYRNVQFFVQEKHKIAGEKPGSGNTENIGSIKTTDIEDFRQGRGPFAKLGEDICELYWSNYPRYRETKVYTDLVSFERWLKQNKPEAYNLYLSRK